MTTRNLLLLIIALISYTLSTDIKFSAIPIHNRAELGKVITLSDGTILITSNSIDGDKSYVSKLNENAGFIYHNNVFKTGYTGNAQITESKLRDGSTGYILYHKKGGEEFLTEIQDQKEEISNSQVFNTVHEQVSLLTLKSGKLFFMGITKPTEEGYPTSQTHIDLKIYDPVANTESGNGISLAAYGQYISCVEIKDNDVYCAYVQDENKLRTLLKIQHFEITDAGVVSKDEPYLIKSFHTQINFVKIVKVSTNEVGILFQFGNNKLVINPHGNTGKDLFYYQLEVSPSKFEVIRDDFLSDECKFRTDSADYHADIIVLNDDTIYAICEVDNKNKDAIILRAFEIIKNEKQVAQIDFNVNNYGAKAVKNPVLIKFDEDSLGLLCTLIEETTGVKNVVLIMMNFPDCEDSQGELKYIEKCPNKKELENNDIFKHIKIYMSNPFVQNSAKDIQLNIRIINSDGFILKHQGEVIKANNDYDISSLSHIIVDKNENNGQSEIKYTVTYKNAANRIITGRTCTIKIKKPKCVDQCKDGCDEGSSEDDNRCFNCIDGYYPEKKTTIVKICGENTTLYNCKNCYIACEKCFGPYLDGNPPTTNCKYVKRESDNYTYCNYIDGYFPYEDEPRTCFSEDEKEDWEEKLDQPVYLDKRNKNDNTTWIWRKCHPNCQQCAGHGTEEQNNCTVCKNGLYFYCNQTWNNSGIPGSCHEDCTKDGCYASKKEDTEGIVKMCPCFPHCKICKNKDTCDVCRNEWLLHPERTSCDKDCGYCYVPEWENPAKKENGVCINCVEKYGPNYYTYGNKCYKEEEIPTFTYTEYGKNNWTYTVVKKYHPIDKKCNMLTACKRGCHKCAQEKTDICTECENNYYKEDLRPEQDTFQCYNQTTCRGDDQYPHSPVEYEPFGVPIKRNNQLICLNCKLENDSYRLPAPNYYCGERENRTYVCSPNYKGLCECYFRCKTCDRFGNACSMNCKSCRDSKYYDLVRYNKEEGNCIRKQHKCGIYPYYHNYELSLDEESCGEDCDVCIYNFICPKELPFLKLETRECVEFCPMTQVLGGACNTNSTYALLQLLRNPFGLRNPYEPIKDLIYLNEIITGDLFKYFCFAYSCNPNELLKEINNYIGHGKIYNLPESQFFFFNNMSVELTTVKLELEKLKNYLGGNRVNITNIYYLGSNYNGTPGSSGSTGGDEEEPYQPSGIDLSACEQILKKKYGLSAEEELMIIKADLLKEYNFSDEFIDFYSINNDYQLFSTSLGAFLPLYDCKEEGEDIEVTNPFTLFGSTPQSKLGSALHNGYDAFSPDSPFYNDVCTPFTNENGNDVLLDDRRRDYFSENINLCEKNCKFVRYNTGSKTYTCRCPIKSTPGEESEETATQDIERNMPENFKDFISRRSNIAVFKCASLVFSKQGFKKNYGAYILLVAIAAFIGVVLYHFIIEKSKSLNDIFRNLGKNANPSNPPKVKAPEEDPKKKYDVPSGVRMSQQPKADNIKKDLTYNDYQLNFVPYTVATKLDKRSFLCTYWSFLKSKQLCIFTFYTKEDNILRSTKIALFILFVSFYMAFTALFFNDSIMRALYIYKGNTDAAVHVPNIILSSLCSFIASIIIRFICLGERDISKILNEKEKDKRKALSEMARKKATIKLYIFYFVSFLLILLCWYYVAAFCAVFQNSQTHYLINFLICFLICNVWPVITSLIPSFLRKKALDNRSRTLYKVSQIVSIF